MAIDIGLGSVNNAQVLISLAESLGTGTQPRRIRAPTVTAEQAEGTFTGRLPDGRNVSFNVSDFRDGRARVRYSSANEVKNGQVQVNGNVLRFDNVQLAVLSNGRAQFSRVDPTTSRVQQATLQR
ncbi:hypothetical protein [Candidatus Raskinella chloraquaticus]|uniref:Uncharacterized protein n=1 Tax=Candidatus Raskinella chloraquaticus TaxID=1951219 RepID=A0A1W9HWX7_9HYPH|nr:hypothetical protein [Hyphomicrobiales bacterium]OQW51817.1 MAG: hypothetical protein A4S15_10095 [Proteobacteria bacterium SG_bin8]OQW80957.1 MAG: hypothetical protein BVN31_12435 [Proteobacteria bacterium ST_bin15]